MKARRGIVDPAYVIEAQVVAAPDGSVVEGCPYEHDSWSIMLHWICSRTGATLGVVVTARDGTAPATAMRTLREGDVVVVDGRAQQLLWPGVISELVVMRNPRRLAILTQSPRAANGVSR